MNHRLLTFLTILSLLRVAAFPQCPVSPGVAVKANVWDAIFTQDGPGKGLEPARSPGWTGGDSTYSLLLPNGDTAFFFSDSYIGESPRVKGDGSVTRDANGLRTTGINCPPPICDPAASIFGARNAIVILGRDRKKMRTLVGPKNENGISTSYFKEPADGFYYWMGDAMLLPANGEAKARIFVFLHKFDAKLEFHGAAVAQLNATTLAIEKLIEVKNLPGNEIHWGTAMLLHHGRIMIYGKGARDGKKQVFLAQPDFNTIESLTDAATWMVWTGRTYLRGFQHSEPIMPAGDSVSDEFNIVPFEINGKTTYLLAAVDTTAPWGSWRDITLYSSCRPEGPFTGKHVVYAMPESNASTVPGLARDTKLKQHLVVYNPHIHSQFSGNGRILISYNINRTHNSDTIFIDGYRPRFIYVPIAGLK